MRDDNVAKIKDAGQGRTAARRPSSSTSPPGTNNSPHTSNDSHEPNTTHNSANDDTLLKDLVDDDKPLGGEDVDSILADHTHTNLFHLLQQLGVDVVDACNVVGAIRKRPTATFYEMFGQGRIVQAAAHGHRRVWNCHGLGGLDLRTLKPNGEPLNFSLQSDRDLAEQLIDRNKPTWLIGSPPCSPCCHFNWAVNYKKMAPERVREILTEGITHIHFMTHLY